MKKQKVTIEGKEIEHQDVIHHNTITSLSFKDRLRVLFGKKIHVESRIYTDHEYCLVLGSDSKTYVEKIYQRKPKGGYGLECVGG